MSNPDHSRAATWRVPARMMFGLAATLFGCLAIAWSVWRLIDDARPVASLATIQGHIKTGRLDEAKQELRDVLRRSPRHGEAMQMLARVLAKQGDLLGCADLLRRVPNWWPNKRDVQFHEAEAYQQLHMAARAEAAWLGCVTDDPLHPAAPAFVRGAAKSLIALYLMQNRHDDARAVLWQAYQQATDAEKPAVLGTFLRVELERIDPAEASDTLGRYVAADPTDWNSRVALAVALASLEWTAQADAILSACLVERPTDVPAWRARLETLEQRGDAKALADAVARVPIVIANGSDPVIQKIRAAALESGGDLVAAQSAIDRALKVAPYDDELHFRAARLATRAGNPDQASQHRDRYAKLSKARRDLPAALADFGNADNSTNADAAARLERLATICETLGWPDVAKAWHQQAVRTARRVADRH